MELKFKNQDNTKSMTPLISLVIPIYNVEKYLNQCIDSVLNQDLIDIEIILVDDGSTDDSSMICDEYAQKDNRVKVIHQKNRGLSNARNTGITAATGYYLMFLDSDDWWNEKVSVFEIFKFVNKNPDVDLFIYDSIDYNEIDGSHLKRKCKAPIYKKKYSTIEAYEYFSRISNIREAAFNKIIKRSTILKNKLFFKEGIVNEDIDWMYRILRIVKSISFLQYDLIYYRMGRIGSISNSIKPKNLFDMISIIRESLEYYENEFKNDEIKAFELDNSLKLWFTVLGLHNQLEKKEKKEITKELKVLSSITNHAISRRTKTVTKLYKNIGFFLTSIILSLYNSKFRIIANKKTITDE